MDYTPYYETMRRTSLLHGMTDTELDTLMACFAPRVRRYACLLYTSPSPRDA